MDAFWPILSAFPGAVKAARTNKHLDLVLKDHIVAVNKLASAHRPELSNNVREVLTVCPSHKLVITAAVLINTRNSTHLSTPSPLQLSSFSPGSWGLLHPGLAKLPSLMRRSGSSSTSTLCRSDM